MKIGLQLRVIKGEARSLLAGFVVLALVPWVSQASECTSFESPRDVITCALSAHPEIRGAQAGVLQSQELEGVAAQRPNPELSSQAVTARTVDGNLYYIEFNLAHTFELGGKRGARIGRAQAAQGQAQAELLKAREQVYVTTLISLYRLRQAHSELKIVEDALATFSKIQRFFHSRPRLSPDQQVSLQILELAEGDYIGKKASLESDILLQNKNLELATGIDLSQNNRILPARRTEWPVMTDQELEQPPGGGIYGASVAALQFAQANLSVERSTGWPDLKIGPTFEHQTQGFFGYEAFGLNFTLPLPLFHLNGAGKAAANHAISRSEIALKAARKEVSDQRELFLKKYQVGVQVLKSTPSELDIARKRRSTQALLDQGLVSGALVLEAQRQILDFTRTQNEHELSALEALAKLYAMSGRLFQERLL